MKKTDSHPLTAYEEDKHIKKQIIKILSADTSTSKKRKQLKDLYASTKTELAKSHVLYFQKKLDEKKHRFYKTLIVAPIILLFATWTLYRICYVLYPEYFPFVLNLGISELQMILFISLIPVYFLIYYIIQYLHSK